MRSDAAAPRPFAGVADSQHLEALVAARRLDVDHIACAPAEQRQPDG
jgi:hypothetical protein